MNARELRIGNIIDLHVEGADRWLNAHTVTANDIECIELGTTAQGIPLSPEWLERFGFKKRQGWGGNEFYFLHTGYIEFQWEEGGFLISIEDQNLLLDHIKTVHQLQNLYYALTSEEL